MHIKHRSLLATLSRVLRYAPATTFVCALLLARDRPAWAQATTSSAPTITTRSTLVLVPTFVETKASQPVHALTADDFTLTDDGVEQKISLDDDPRVRPLALVVAVQTGGAAARRLDSYKNLGLLVEAIVGGAPHQVAVVEFSSRPNLLQNFTPDLNTITDTLAQLTPDDNGAAILDGLSFSVNLLRRQPPAYRRAILLLSETVDRGSTIPLEDALRGVSDTNTAIYSLAFSTGKSEAAHYGDRQLPRIGHTNPYPNPPSGCMGKDPDPDPDATQNKAVQLYDCLTQLAPPLALAKMAAILATDSLRRNAPKTVADLTGGEFFAFKDTRSLERALTAISNHIPNQYVLSFQPQSPHPGLHTLKLTLKAHPDLSVKARTSYWADFDSTIAPQP